MASFAINTIATYTVSCSVCCELSECGDMSAIDFSGSGTNQEVDDHGSVLPGYVPYFSLVFKVITTTANVLLSGWVVYTIITTRRLHKPHNIFVANLLVSGTATISIVFITQCSMMLSFQLGVEPLISCFAFKFMNIPIFASNLSYVIIAADKLLAMVYFKTFSFKYKKIMTPRVVAAVVTGTWLLAIIPAVDEVTEVPIYGACILKGNVFFRAFSVFVMPMIVAPSLAVVLNVYFTIKYYQANKQVRGETTGATSQSGNIRDLTRMLRRIKRNRKPIITLLVVTLGSTFLNLTVIPLYIIGRFNVDSQVYNDLMEYLIIPNIAYAIHFLQPFVYGLYFKQVREPMMKYLKGFVRMNKVTSVAPQP